jgi:hypothetical protein
MGFARIQFGRRTSLALSKKAVLQMITSIYRQISMQLILEEVVSLGNPRRF